MFILNVVSAGGIVAHPAAEAAGRGRPDTAWSRRGRLSTPAPARGAAGAGCGRAARRALLAGSRRSSTCTAARLGAMEVGGAGRGKVPTQRRTARHRGSWLRRARRSSQRITARPSAVEVCRAGQREVRTQEAGERGWRRVNGDDGTRPPPTLTHPEHTITRTLSTPRSLRSAMKPEATPSPPPSPRPPHNLRALRGSCSHGGRGSLLTPRSS